MLAEELSPRIDLLDRLTDELDVLSRQMTHLQTKPTTATVPPPTASGGRGRQVTA